MEIALSVNGDPIAREVAPQELLLDFLRDSLGLTGAKKSCEVQVCGACTVLVAGLPVSSCCYLAADADGREVTTIEGLAKNGTLHPMQAAFRECHGLQCGFCTTGMVMSAVDLLKHNPKATEAEIREALDGNICRCTGYHNIVKAIQFCQSGQTASA